MRLLAIPIVWTLLTTIRGVSRCGHSLPPHHRVGMPRLALALFLSVLPLPAQFLPPTAGIDATALGEVVLTGDGVIGILATTRDSPPACVSADGYSTAPYVARLSLPAMQIAYAGYLPARSLWLAGPDAVLASYPYTGAVPLAVLPPGPPQPGTVTCLANAATYAGYTYGNFDIAPGEIVSLFGNQIGPPTPGTAAFDAAGNITSQLSGIQVLAGGLPAPLLYAAPNQNNLV